MFGVKKTPKSQKPDNLPIYFYNPHTKKPFNDDYNRFWNQDYRQLAIFDIGYENLARRIARRHMNPQKIEVIAYDKIPISLETDEDGFRVLFNELETWLEMFKSSYLESHIIIIEWQLPQNYKAVRISTFILAYFYFLLKDSPLLPLMCEMRSGFKDEYYPELKTLNQNARKSKCVEIGIKILEAQEDFYSLAIIEGGTSRKKKTKKDDYADLVIMEEVFCRYALNKGWNFPAYEEGKFQPLSEPISSEKQSLDDYLKQPKQKKIVIKKKQV